jgi:hypothetical protein
MAEARDAYIKATFELSKHAPSEWATFVEAFKVFTMHEYELGLSVPAGEVQVAMGMNRRMRDLRNDFVHIENLADKLRK